MNFFALTSTNYAEFQKKNREEGEKYKDVLQILRDDLLKPIERFFGAEIKVLSAFRCEELNRLVGGSPKSEHLKGCAADILIGGKTCEEAFAVLRSADIKYGQLILEKSGSSVWLHVSLPWPQRAKELCGQSFVSENGRASDFSVRKFYE